MTNNQILDTIKEWAAAKAEFDALPEGSYLNPAGLDQLENALFRKTWAEKKLIDIASTSSSENNIEDHIKHTKTLQSEPMEKELKEFHKWYSNRFRNATDKGFIHGIEDMMECWEASADHIGEVNKMVESEIRVIENLDGLRLALKEVLRYANEIDPVWKVVEPYITTRKPVSVSQPDLATISPGTKFSPKANEQLVNSAVRRAKAIMAVRDTLICIEKEDFSHIQKAETLIRAYESCYPAREIGGLREKIDEIDSALGVASDLTHMGRPLKEVRQAIHHASTLLNKINQIEDAGTS